MVAIYMYISNLKDRVAAAVQVTNAYTNHVAARWRHHHRMYMYHHHQHLYLIRAPRSPWPSAEGVG